MLALRRPSKKVVANDLRNYQHRHQRKNKARKIAVALALIFRGILFHQRQNNDQRHKQNGENNQ